MIIKKDIKSSDISFLQKSGCLYISDFRAISESMSYSIPAMWKYENLLPWILKNKDVCVNENAIELKFKNKNNLIVLPRKSNPKISIFKKVSNKIIKKHKIKELWVAIPHPDAGVLAKKYNLKLNYTYQTFDILNDKLRQKELIPDLTPNYENINSLEQIIAFKKNNRNGFIKKRHGSGGYTVFKIENVFDSKFEDLFKKAPNDWYFEEFAEGEPHSIQCLKTSDSEDIVVFGFTKQHILEERYFTGSSIYSTDKINKKVWVQLKKALKNFSSMLKPYEGFFGVDFMIDSKANILILEANIRMTTATIPTLISNDLNIDHSEYREDLNIKKNNIKNLILTEDKIDNLSDQLKLY